MFGEFSASIVQLDGDQRQQLAALLSDRAEYLVLAAELCRRKSALLANPTSAAEQALSEYSSTVVAPARRKVAEQTVELVGDAIDLDKPKGLLPMLLMGAITAVNVPLVLNALGLDPDTISEIAQKGKEYFQHGA